MSKLHKQLDIALVALREIDKLDPPACTDESASLSNPQWRGRCRDMSRIARNSIRLIEGKQNS